MRFSPCTLPSLLVALVILVGGGPAHAQDPAANGVNFPGVAKVLSPEQYSAAGLDKLTPAEKAKLDSYLKGYFTGATDIVVKKAVAQASSQAVDQAVKEHKVQPPELIESRILGPVSGWKSGKIFVLENGQHWKVTEEDRHFPTVVDPEVFILRDFMSYKMAIAGGGVTRVMRLQ